MRSLSSALRTSSDPTRPVQSRMHIFFLPSISFAFMLILGGVLAACGGPGTTSPSSSKTVLTELDYLSAEPANTMLNNMISAYEKTHPDVTIQRDSVPFSAMLPKASQEAAAHTLPDILSIDNPDLDAFAATGALVDLDSYLTGSLSKASFFAGSLSTMTYNSKIYAVSTGNNDLALFYNKKMFAAANLNPPTTWAELEADAKALTKGNTYGFALSAAAEEEATWQFEPFLWSNNGDITKVDSQQSVQALQYLTSMVQQGYISKAALKWGQGDVETQFAGGHAAMMENGPWNLTPLKTANLNYNVDYGIVPMPTPQTGGKPVSPLGGEIWTIPQSDQAHEQAAWNFLSWVEQPTQLLTYDQIQGYLPPQPAVSQVLLANKDNVDLTVFTNELTTARARTAVVGTKYPSISQAIWTAEQAAFSGSLSPQAALTQAQQSIDKILQSQS
jgi:multiple sugar transport system substrate-binding protein